MNNAVTVYQVSELASEMRRLMESSYPEIWIEGELSSLSAPASGHLYFTLKDESSQLRCAMFRNRAGISRYRPKAGDLVRVRARISVYTARGDLQCLVQHIEAAGEGVLQRRFDELKVKLQAEGLFASEHKQAVPEFTRHIGLITSPSGAAITDILTTLKRRSPGIRVTVYPAVVQGEGAAHSLMGALADAIAHQQCDVLLLSRGGGSLEDLWCFNDEALARAIHACPIPIVSAVGHEIDFSIADFVADLRAPTPTAAAELLSPDQQQVLHQLASTGQRMRRSLAHQLQSSAQRVDLMFGRLEHPRTRIAHNQRRVQNLGRHLKTAISGNLQRHGEITRRIHLRLGNMQPQARLAGHRAGLQQLTQRLQRGQQQAFKSRDQRVAGLGEQLHIVSPLATLERGFSIVRDHSQGIVRNSQEVAVGEELSVQLGKGELHIAVTGRKP